jgi:hypothetical protein
MEEMKKENRDQKQEQSKVNTALASDHDSLSSTLPFCFCGVHGRWLNVDSVTRSSPEEVDPDDNFASIPEHHKLRTVQYVGPRPTSNTADMISGHRESLPRVHAPFAEGCGFPTGYFCRLSLPSIHRIRQRTLLDMRSVGPLCGECN